MTKVQNPIIGRAKGSAGGMTFSKNSDQNVMRAKAFEVNNPKTTAQTTQRDFFKEVQIIVDSVSPEQLRSLFGNKPKKMSRRNALFKQVAAAYSVDGTTKSIDFSKLLAVGNGEKMNTPFAKVTNGRAESDITITKAMLNVDEDKTPNFILVFFDEDNNRITLVNTADTVEDEVSYEYLFSRYFENVNGYMYVTCSTTGENVSQRGFGSFIIKTRGTTKSSASVQH